MFLRRVHPQATAPPEGGWAGRVPCGASLAEAHRRLDDLAFRAGILFYSRFCIGSLDQSGSGGPISSPSASVSYGFNGDPKMTVVRVTV
jgi:hypothetical protein